MFTKLSVTILQLGYWAAAKLANSNTATALNIQVWIYIKEELKFRSQIFNECEVSWTFRLFAIEFIL